MEYNQKQMWENNFLTKCSQFQVSKFVKECLDYFPDNGKILELGCGIGKDSIYLAQNGFNVTALDFYSEAIKRAKQDSSNKKIKQIDFLVHDISKKLKLNDNSFDVIFAHLSLHYFTDKVTRKIFQEINRVIKISGILCVCCKSINDPLYGQGEKIEKDIYIKNGHVRHFFSEKYIKDLIKDNFEIVKLYSGTTKFYKSKAAFVKLVARKI